MFDIKFLCFTSPHDTPPQFPWKLNLSFSVADDDSGTDENCDSPLLSPPTPPSSGFAMAKKMTVGVVSDESGDASKSGDPVPDSDEKLVFSLGLLLSCQLPAAATLTELRQRKKVKCSFKIFRESISSSTLSIRGFCSRKVLVTDLEIMKFGLGQLKSVS